VAFLILAGCAQTAPATSKPAETSISIHVETTSKNALRVYGTTNLPEEAVLNIRIFPGSGDSQGAQLYGVKVPVRGGRYEFSFADATRLPRGPYLVDVKFSREDQVNLKVGRALQTGQLREKSVRAIRDNR
jgi:hypothetical protein